MNIIFSEFKRIFSMSMYKNKRIPMGEMTFTKDFSSEYNWSYGNLYIFELGIDTKEEQER